MLKVCGVTFDHTTNYGSCLQAYALQNVIEGMEIGGEKCEYQWIPRSTFPTKKYKTRNPVVMAKRLIYRRLTAYRRNRFATFENKYLHFADCHSQDDLPKLNELFDAFVCGSDVIWNLSFTKADPIYFLDFAERYKFAYAASFGVKDIDNDYDGFDSDTTPSQIFARYLPTLDSIGVREKSAVKTVKTVANVPAEHVVDPVLLLSAHQWQSIASRKKRRPYIFAYSTYSSPNYLHFIKRLKQQTGLPVIHVSWDIKTALFHGAVFVPTPEEWLRLIIDAEYVVTNSFHATVLSSLFHKKIFCAMRDEKICGTRVRLYDFLSEMGLKNRAYGYTPDHIDTSQPDFDLADRNISLLRERSIAFLRDNLEAALLQKRG